MVKRYLEVSMPKTKRKVITKPSSRRANFSTLKIGNHFSVNGTGYILKKASFSSAKVLSGPKRDMVGSIHNISPNSVVNPV